MKITNAQKLHCGNVDTLGVAEFRSGYFELMGVGLNALNVSESDSFQNEASGSDGPVVHCEFLKGIRLVTMNSR